MSIVEQTCQKLLETLQIRINIATDVEHTLAKSRKELKAWQTQALINNVTHACNHSPFYSQHIPQALVERIKQGDIDCLNKIPFTTRDDIMYQYPYGLLATPKEHVVRFNESSGTTTGESISACFTAKDWVINNTTVACFLSAILTPEDCVAIAVPYELAGVGQDLDRAVELLNCTVVSLGALTGFCPPERMINIIHQAQVTTLICSGTRALYLAQVAKQQGLDPKNDLKIDKILFAGEGASPAKRKILEQLWGAKVYAMYGMTETNTLAMFCTENKLHLVENRNWFEVVEPQTGQTLADGNKGELTVTSLCSEAMPLVRYRTGDHCIIDPTPCQCGSALRVLQHMGRANDKISVQNKDISQLQLEDSIMGNMKDAPYYFSFISKQDYLLIGLCAANFTTDIMDAIKQEINTRFNIPVQFTQMSESVFVDGLTNAAKPTMTSFLLKSE